jgi:hypothetical protein
VAPLRPLAALLACSLSLPAPARAVSVTMPTNDSYGGPVTITVGDPTASRSPQPSAREPRESAGGGVGAGGGGGSDDGALILGLILAAPVVVVGGIIHVAGQAISDWLAARERRRLQAEERRRLEAEDRARVAVVRGQLRAATEAGREALYAGIEATLDFLASESIAAAPFPYAESDAKTEMWKIEDPRYGRDKYGIKDREHLHDARIIDAYRTLWAQPGNQAALRLVTPRHLKAILAHESQFRADNGAGCSPPAKTCLYGVRPRTRLAHEVGVGLASINRITAGDAGVRVDETADERLDPEKAIAGALRVIVSRHRSMTRFYRSGDSAPSDDLLWSSTLLGYTMGAKGARGALRDAADELGKSPGEMTWPELEKPRAGGSLLRRHAGSENSYYVLRIRELLPAGDPRKESR